MDGSSTKITCGCCLENDRSHNWKLGNVGVPIKLLFEAEGMKVSVEVSAFSIVAFASLIDSINN